MRDAWEVRGRCVGGAWEVRGRCVGGAWVRGIAASSAGEAKGARPCHLEVGGHAALRVRHLLLLGRHAQTVELGVEFGRLRRLAQLEVHVGCRQHEARVAGEQRVCLEEQCQCTF